MTRKRRTLLAIFMFLVIFLISFGVSEKTQTEYITLEKAEPRVFVTKSGECYHSCYCHYLTSSARDIGLYKAISNGFRACSYCHGVSDETITVQYIQKYEKDNTLYVFIYCLGISLGLSGGVYLILTKAKLCE